MAYTLGDIGNVPGQAFDFLKRQAGRFVNLTKPGADDDDYTTRSAAIARQKKLADMLSQMGEQEQAVSTAGGITAPMSGMGALARGLTSFGGAYLSGKASADEAAATKAKEGEDAETLRKMGEALAGTPEETVALAPTDPTLGQRNLQDIMSMSGSRQATPDELAAALGGNAPPGRAVMKNMVPGDVSKAAQIGLGNPRFANQSLALQVSETQRRIKQAEDERDRDQPKMTAVGANGMIDSNPRSPTYGKTFAAPPPDRPPAKYHTATPKELEGYPPGTTAQYNETTNKLEDIHDPKQGNGLTINTGKTIADQMVEKGIVLITDSQSAAQGAVDNKNTNARMLELLDTNKVLAGPGAKIGFVFNQIFAKDPERIVATRGIIKGLAETTIQARKQFKGQGQISDFETRTLEKAVSGDIGNLTVEEIRAVINANNKMNDVVINRHMGLLKKSSKAFQSKDPQDFLKLFEVDEPTQDRKPWGTQ